jgi:transcriptional regulator CtsR
MERLEERVVFYALSGYAWANTNVSASFMPDGTTIDNGTPSNLFAKFDSSFSRADWQREFARALQSWADVTPLNFHLIADSGDPVGITGSTQDDSRFGDVRIGGFNATGVGYAYFPSGGTLGGDAFLGNLGSGLTWHIGSFPDLYSVALHEIGHSIGLDHSSISTAVMYPTTSSVFTGLSADDIAGAQAIYGARQQDAFDAAASNNTLGTASDIALSSGAARFQADLTSLADVDYYRVTAPTGTDGTLTVSVDARNLSLLAPKVSVYNASGVLLGQAAVGTSGYGTVATATISGLVAGQTYYVAADGATSDVFGMGAYVLDARFGTGSVAVPSAPTNLSASAASSSQINLVWQDNAANEAGYRVEQSTDGVNFMPVATLGVNATSYSVTGLSASTTYYFRVRAYNSGGDSASSNTAQATTQAATLTPPTAPSGLSATTASSSQINLGWQDNATNESGYLVERSTDGVNFTQVATLGTNATTYAMAGLSATTTYYFHVRAYNTGGNSSWSNMAEATTQGVTISAPLAPSGLTATAASSSQINLAWQDNATNEDGYRIERSSDGVNFTLVTTVGANAKSYAVTGLAASTTYSFRVRAYNSGGDSAWSNTAAGTTPAAPLAADRYETNNTLKTATNLGRTSSVNLTGLTIHTATDVDYFVFTPKSNGNHVIAITFSQAQGNLNLAVYNSKGSLIASSTSTTDNESLTLNLSSNQKYYIKVYGQSGALNSYSLAINTAAALKLAPVMKNPVSTSIPTTKTSSPAPAHLVAATPPASTAPGSLLALLAASQVQPAGSTTTTAHASVDNGLATIFGSDQDRNPLNGHLLCGCPACQAAGV